MHLLKSALLCSVPAAALTLYGPTAWQALAPMQRMVAHSPLVEPARAPDKREQWTDTAITPDSVAEATLVVRQLNQQIASLLALRERQTDDVLRAILNLEAGAVRAGLTAFQNAVANNPLAPGRLSPYGLARAQSAALMAQIASLRQFIGQVNNPVALTLFNQQLQLKYQEALVLNRTYRELTGRRAPSATIFSQLVSLNTAILRANLNALAAQEEQVTTRKLLPVSASVFTFSGGAL